MILVRGIDRTPLTPRAYYRFLQKFCRTGFDALVSFSDEKGTGNFAEHCFDPEYLVHEVTIFTESLATHPGQWTASRDGKHATTPLKKINKTEVCARIIHLSLHEFKHAQQFERDPIKFDTNDTNQLFKHKILRYLFSPIEAEAEGWALMKFNEAFDYYLKEAAK